MEATPFADLIQSLCTALSDMVGEIDGVTNLYESTDNKLQTDSLNLVTKDAGEVSFYGMGATAFYGSVKQSIADISSEMESLSNVGTAASTCHNALINDATKYDNELQQAESTLSSYQSDMIAVYGQATYPYTYLLGIIAGLDLNSIILEGRTAVTSVFQTASYHLEAPATRGGGSDPAYHEHVIRAVAGSQQLTTQIQSICENWAEQVHSEVTTFNTSVSSQNNGSGYSSQWTMPGTSKTLQERELRDANEEGGENHTTSEESDKESTGVDIGPYWQGNAYNKTLWQQKNNIGPIPETNVGTFSFLNAQAGAHIGRQPDGTFDAGLVAGGNVVDLNDQDVVGNKDFALTSGTDITALSAQAQIGLEKNSFGASIGGSLVSATSNVGLNIAGENVGVSASVGLSAQLGFEIGEHTEIKLPFVSIGFSFGSAL
jgi:hypothetical protein